MDPSEIDVQVEKSKDGLVQTIYTTLYYKLNLENHESLRKEKVECNLQCYKNFDENPVHDFGVKYEKLGSCISYCDGPMNDVKSYDRNIDFMSLTKFDGCSQGCYTDLTTAGPIKEGAGKKVMNMIRPPAPVDPAKDFSKIDNKQLHYTECLSDCYMRLLKRYKGYWKEHKNKLLKRYNSQEI